MYPQAELLHGVTPPENKSEPVQCWSLLQCGAVAGCPLALLADELADAVPAGRCLHFPDCADKSLQVENEGCFCKGSGIYWSHVHLAPVGAAWCVGVPFCEMSNQRKKEDPLTCLAVFLFIYQNWRSHFFFLFLSTESPCSAEPWLGFSDFCCRTHRAAFLVGYSGSSEHIWVTDSVLWLCNTFTWCLVVQRLWLVFNNQLIGSLASQIKPQLTTSRFHRRAHIWVGGVGCCIALCAGLEHVYALVSSDCFVL